MDTLRQSLFSLCAAALFCSLVCELLKATSLYPLVRWVSGLVLLVTLLKPLGSIPDLHLERWYAEGASHADALIEQAEQDTLRAKAAHISARTSSYILDIAESLGIDARVEVAVSEDAMPVPIGVRIYAQTSPYLKLRLEEWIQENLNIPKEKLIWIG